MIFYADTSGGGSCSEGLEGAYVRLIALPALGAPVTVNLCAYRLLRHVTKLPIIIAKH